jgi:hypothetical protein
MISFDRSNKSSTTSQKKVFDTREQSITRLVGIGFFQAIPYLSTPPPTPAHPPKKHILFFK